MRYTETTIDAFGPPGATRYYCRLDPCRWAADFELDEGESFSVGDLARSVDAVLRSHLNAEHPGWTIDDLRMAGVRALPTEGTNAHEVAWWRQFATKFGPTTGPPPVGTPLTGHRFELYVVMPNGERRVWADRRG